MPPTTLRHLPADRAATLPPLLHALWQDAHGHWDAGHTLTPHAQLVKGTTSVVPYQPTTVPAL